MSSGALGRPAQRDEEQKARTMQEEKANGPTLHQKERGNISKAKEKARTGGEHSMVIAQSMERSRRSLEASSTGK